MHGPDLMSDRTVEAVASRGAAAVVDAGDKIVDVVIVHGRHGDKGRFLLHCQHRTAGEFLLHCFLRSAVPFAGGYEAFLPPTLRAFPARGPERFRHEQRRTAPVLHRTREKRTPGASPRVSGTSTRADRARRRESKNLPVNVRYLRFHVKC